MSDSTADIDLTSDDPLAWQLLQTITATAAAVEDVAYNMRIVTHLLANSDHRHLGEYATDMNAAVDRLAPVDAELRQQSTTAATAWGVPSPAPLSTIVAAAPQLVAAPLSEALAQLQGVTRELQEDGAIASEVLEAATRIVSQRCRELEQMSADPRYRPPAISR